jgi:ABC-type multidrug transport system fused ATPase/permease subunit
VKNLKQVVQSSTMRLSWRLMWQQKSFTLSLLFCILMGSLLSLVHPYAMKLFIDEGVAKESRGVLIFTSLIFMLEPVVRLLISGLHSSLEEELTTHVDVGLQGFLRRKLQSVSPFRLFHQYKQGELAVGLTEWTGKISYNVSSVIPELLEKLVSSVLVVLAMWWINPMMTVLCLGSITAMTLVKRSLKKYQRLNRALFQIQNNLMAHTAEFVRGFMVIQLYGAAKRENEEFDRLRWEYQKTRRKTFWTKIIGIDLLSSVTDAIITGTVLLVGVVFFETLSPGQALQFMSYIVTLQVSVKWFFRRYLSLLEMAPDLERCDELLHLEEITCNPNAVELDEVKCIEFRGVTASYPGSETPAVRDVTLTIHQGEKVAFVGTSGGGKSTLAYLLVRMLEPQAGEILINEKPIEDYTLQSLRSKFVLCTQGAVVLDRSIEENLRLGHPDATDGQLGKVVRCVDLELPEGYQDQQATELSGGQTQRLGLARALLQEKGEVFLLDEYTSAVDSITEFHMMEGVSCILEGKTQITIAHRYSTIRNVDRVVVLQSGEILQVGTQEELLAEKAGLYYSLWTKQMGAEEISEEDRKHNF